MEVSLELAAEMLLVSGAAADIEEARARCRRAVADGSALERFRRVVIAQGGDGRVCDAPDTVLPRAARVELVHADRAGFVAGRRAWPIGQASMLLGAGRSTVDSRIDPAAGIVLSRRVGDPVHDGDVLAELHVNAEHADALTAAKEMILTAFRIEAQPVPRPPLILGRL